MSLENLRRFANRHKDKIKLRLGRGIRTPATARKRKTKKARATEVAVKGKSMDTNIECIGLLRKDYALKELKRLRILLVIQQILAAKNMSEINDVVQAALMPIQVIAVEKEIASINQYLRKWNVPIEEELKKIELSDEDLSSIDI